MFSLSSHSLSLSPSHNYLAMTSQLSLIELHPVSIDLRGANNSQLYDRWWTLFFISSLTCWWKIIVFFFFAVFFSPLALKMEVNCLRCLFQVTHTLPQVHYRCLPVSFFADFSVVQAGDWRFSGGILVIYLCCQAVKVLLWRRRNLERNVKYMKFQRKSDLQKMIYCWDTF